MKRYPTTRLEQSGMILLVVMGMLAVFSLLAVTFVVFSGQSKTGSIALERPIQRGMPGDQLSNMVVHQLIRGTQDTLSGFYAHSLLEDVYGTNSIASQFRTPVGGASLGVIRMRDTNTSRNLPFVILPLDPTIVGLPSEDDAYNGRLFTFLGGPLAGKTFRILQYIGNRPAAADTSDQTEGNNYHHCVVIDLSEVPIGSMESNGTLRSAHDYLSRWVGNLANEIAFSATNYADPSTYIPYRFLINDAPFNGVGFGLEVSGNEIGNLAQGVWLDPNDPLSGPKIPVGLLHHYNGARFPDNTVDPVTNTWRRGGTNEGFDVADYRDRFLAARFANAVIPSFHRPEVINFIANLYGDPASLSVVQVRRFLQILQFSTARPLGMITGDPLSNRNVRFAGRPPTGNPFLQPVLNIDLSDNSVDPIDAANLQAFVAWLIDGPWDVDNDGDGIPDSVWVDPNLPLIVAADGKLLRVLVAPLIEDLDGRLNVNAHGDFLQSVAGYQGSGPVDDQFADHTAIQYLSQGFGYGPADISFLAAITPVRFANMSLGRYGTDQVPGIAGDDVVSRYRERGLANPFRHLSFNSTQASTGLPLGRRGQLAIGIDRFGNPLLRNVEIAGNYISETIEDSYEMPQRSPAPSDSPYEFAELEAILRRFDADAAILPSRLRDRLGLNVNDTIHHLLTTRNSEIRSPVIGAPVIDTNTNTHLSPGNFFGWLQLLYQERYRSTTEAAQLQQVNANILRNLFLPVEFRKGLKLNINRPFGNGQDSDNDGQIDDPHELFYVGQQEVYPGDANFDGEYIFGAASTTPHLASRQLLARQLYLLAQLIVPRNYVFPGTDQYPNATQTDRDRLRARILAQWAVNVVDFRDSDAAMTRFEFDIWPFGRESVGGDPVKEVGWNPYWPNPANSNDPSMLQGNVVWGMEFPELALTESLAFHDKRMKDTQDDPSGLDTNSMPTPDNHMDQYRLPQGSAFLEIFNLRTTATSDNQYTPAAPPTLYTQDGSSNVLLDLSRMSPAGGAFGMQPVWRVGISNYRPPSQTAQYQSVTFGLEAATGLHFDLADYTFSDPNQELIFDRMVWFNGIAPAGVVPNLRGGAAEVTHRVFRYRSGSQLLAGGSYCVIGPRQQTFVGSNNLPTPPVNHQPSAQYIEIQANQVDVYKLDGTVATSLSGAASIKTPIGMIVAADPPDASWNVNFPLGVGFNISEPIPQSSEYYSPRPTSRLNSTDNGNPTYPQYPGFADMPPDSWKDFGSNPTARTLPDEPFDMTNPILVSSGIVSPTDGSGEGTATEFVAAYLQRLADPEFPYDPVYNPYITIDWIPIDLTVFNGEDNDTAPGTIQFASRYKDGRQMDAANAMENTMTAGMTFLTYSTADLNTTPAYSGAYDARGDAPYFNYLIGGYTHGSLTNPSSMSLGYLNEGRLDPAATDITDTSFFDAYGPASPSAWLAVHGAPQATVQSQFWFNRPFASPAELMLVPFAARGQLNQLTHVVRADGIYQTAGASASPFGTSFDFFGRTPMKTLPDGDQFWQKGQGPVSESDLSLLLELVETPQGYVDAGKVIPPRLLTNVDVSMPNIQPSIVGNPYFFMSAYLAPNNEVSSYVNSGKLNLNTVYDRRVWEGVEWNYFRGTDRATPAGQSNWNAISNARRGYTPSSANAFFAGFHPSPLASNMNAQYPTQFAGAFRSGFQTNIAPELPSPVSSPNHGLEGLRGSRSDSTTMFRQNPLIPGQPLFTGSVANQRTYRGGATTQPQILGKYQQSDRQTYMALQRMMRLPNLVSQQSNVYAAWLTIGFFEFDPVNGLGPEYVGSSGEIKRHKAFYIIDRSVPVGFRIGEDINVENTIMLRRFIK